MPGRGRVAAYWLFVQDFARCEGRSPHAVIADTDNIWRGLGHNERSLYVEAAHILNYIYGNGTMAVVKRNTNNLFHWREECRENHAKCGLSSVQWRESVDRNAVHRECVVHYGSDLMLTVYL